MVVPVPLALAIERHDEQVPALQVLEEHARPLRSEQASQSDPQIRSSTDVRVRNSTSVFVQPIQQLGVQVVADEAVVTRKGVARIRPGSARLQRKRGEVEARRPPLGPADEIVQLRVVEIDARAVEHQWCFGVGHRKVGGADLHDASLDAKTRRWDRELVAGADRHLRPGREV